MGIQAAQTDGSPDVACKLPVVMTRQFYIPDKYGAACNW
jgi:hypothetical protein